MVLWGKRIGSRLFWDSAEVFSVVCIDFICEDLLLFSKIPCVMAEIEETSFCLNRIESRKIMIVLRGK